MKINLVLNPANKSWIIQKIADRLSEELKKIDVDVCITENPDPTADLIHHMSWAFAAIKTKQPSTMFITHLDDSFKVKQVHAMLGNQVRMGICMSSDTMQQLQKNGSSQESLFFISPAHDGVISAKRIVIGITSRIYPDGRKREKILQQVADILDLTPFEFRIFGQGWEPTIRKLEDSGAKVTYFKESNDFRNDYDIIINEVPNFDYYLYLGMDEGSLGTLDALAAGVPTIITPQGFHLDIPDGITHSVITADDLKNIFIEISSPYRARIASVTDLTWATFASKHFELWNSIVNNLSIPNMEYCSNVKYMQSNDYRKKTITLNSLSFRRFVSSVSRLPIFRPLRRLIDKIRFNL